MRRGQRLFHDQPLIPPSCLRNVVALFHVLEKEMLWRESTGKGKPFKALSAHKPIVAVGPEHALEDEILAADNFRMCLYHI